MYGTTKMTLEEFESRMKDARKNKTADPNPQPLIDRAEVLGFVGGVAITLAGITSAIVEVTVTSVGLMVMGGAMVLTTTFLARR